jgi:hypothetical protein
MISLTREAAHLDGTIIRDACVLRSALAAAALFEWNALGLIVEIGP